jgi:DNA-binding transcriptional ArsR family regulator
MSLKVGSLRALAHPVRLQMLSLLTGAQLSATEVAHELGISQANASYHLRQLLAAGEVVVAEERVIRGGVAKIYRHPHEAPPAAAAEDGAHRLWTQALATELVRRAEHRAPGHAGSTDAELWVDPGTWQEVVDTVMEAAKRLHAAARPPRAEGTVRTSTTVSMFLMEPGAGPDPGPDTGSGSGSRSGERRA